MSSRESHQCLIPGIYVPRTHLRRFGSRFQSRFHVLQVRFVTEIALERRTVAMVSLPRHATPITSSKWCIASLDRPDAWPKATVSIEDAILNPPIFYTLRATQRGSQRAYGHRPMHFIESRVSHRWSSSSPTLRKHGTKVAGTIAAGKRRERRSTLPGAHACESHL